MNCDRCGKSSLKNVLYCEHCGERLFRAKVRLVDKTGNDNTLYIFGHDYVIGRDKACEIYLDDFAVSRRHARLYYQDETFFVENLQSKNGVFLNTRKIEHSRLNNYDCIQIGSATLHFYFSEGEFPEDRVYTRTGEFLQETLLKISREIQSKNMLDEVLNTILDGVMAMTNARDAVFWIPDETGEWDSRITRNLQLSDDETEKLFTKLRELVEKMAVNNKHYIFRKNNEQAFVPELNQLADQPYRMLAIALRSRKLLEQDASNNLLGVIFIRALGSGRKLESHKIELIESLVSQAVVAIENTFLYSEALAKRKIDFELELAQQIQNRLLPRELIKTPQSDLAAFSRARGYVGGDYYDVLQVRDESLAIAIADIAGKGIGAALVMSSLQGSLRAQIAYENHPEQIVANINQLIRECTAENLFATFFFCLYFHKQGQLRYVNAGHNPPIVFRKGGKEELMKSSATVLGILEENRGREASIDVHTGDVVMFYTDGLTEAMDENMKQIGIRRVQSGMRTYIDENPDATAKELLSHSLKIVEDHAAGQPQHDDLTVLILKVK